MSRNVVRLSLLLLAMAVSPAFPAGADSAAAISYAEQPVRILRDTGFYLASRGAKLQSGDIVEAGSSGIRIDGASASTVALGPASQLYFKAGAKGVEFVLLNGWMKIQAPRGAVAGVPAIVGSGGLQFDATGSSVILHASPGKTELFVEDGEPGVDELQGARVLHHTKFTREQYAVRSAKQPLKLLPRPPKEFLSGMPPSFLDALAPISFKGPAPPPKMERPAQLADVAPWLADAPAVRQLVQRRFNPPKPAPPPAPSFSY